MDAILEVVVDMVDALGPAPWIRGVLRVLVGVDTKIPEAGKVGRGILVLVLLERKWCFTMSDGDSTGERSIRGDKKMASIFKDFDGLTLEKLLA
jgi:hypothetical protein